MPETLVLTTPETTPAITTWRIRTVYLDVDTPAIKLELISNTGVVFPWRFVPSKDITAAQIRAELRFINSGGFRAVQDKTLQQWLLEQIVQHGGKVGTVSP